MKKNKGAQPGNKNRAGAIPWNKGKKGVQKTSEETRKKLSIAKLGNTNSKGSKHGNWKGGVSFEKIKNGIYVHNRRARIRGGGGSHTAGEWELLKAQYNWTCPCCNRKENDIKLTQDHIIPLIKGGSNNIENIQPLCKSCNSKKNTKIIKY